MSRDKRIQQWLNGSKGTFNTEARPGGLGLAAMESISRWLSTRPDVPAVSMAWMTPAAIHFSFTEETELANPWKPGSDSAEWFITAREAIQLPAGPNFGRQMRALTSLGDTPDGCKVFYNLSRLERVGANGSAEHCRGFIVGMVMEMAGQTWSEDQDIWLVGHGELGDKMINFLGPFHRNMYTAKKVSDVSHSALNGRSATLFILGSSADDLLAFDTVAAPGTSMVTDTVLDNEVTLAIDIRTETTAQVVPLDYELFPVMVTTTDELYTALETQWTARENLLQEFTDTDFTVGDIISAPAPRESRSDQSNVAGWCRQLTGYEQAESIQAIAEAISINAPTLNDAERDQVNAALLVALSRADAEADSDNLQSILNAQHALNEGDTK